MLFLIRSPLSGQIFLMLFMGPGPAPLSHHQILWLPSRLGRNNQIIVLKSHLT